MSLKASTIILLLPIILVVGCTADIEYLGHVETNKTIASAEDAVVTLQEYFKDNPPVTAIDIESLRTENMHYKEIRSRYFGKKIYAWIFNDGHGDKAAIDENGNIMIKSIPS